MLKAKVLVAVPVLLPIRRQVIDIVGEQMQKERRIRIAGGALRPGVSHPVSVAVDVKKAVCQKFAGGQGHIPGPQRIIIGVGVKLGVPQLVAVPQILPGSDDAKSVIGQRNGRQAFIVKAATGCAECKIPIQETRFPLLGRQIARIDRG